MLKKSEREHDQNKYIEDILKEKNKIYEEYIKTKNKAKDKIDELLNFIKENKQVGNFALPDSSKMPDLETEEEAAENIADIYERRATKKDKNVRTFAPPDSSNTSDLETKESEDNILEILEL